MSVRGIASLALTRNAGAVTRADLGKAAGDAPTKEAKALDLLVTMIPTGLVAIYTPVITAIVGAAAPTKDDPHPSELIGLRWGVFTALVVATIALVLAGYYSKQPRPTRFPVLELVGGAIAAAAWGLATPDSALVAMLDGRNKALVPVLVAAVGAVAVLVMTPFLKKQAGGG